MSQISDIRPGSEKHDREAARTSSTGVNKSAFWERLWRMSGIQFVVFFIITAVIYGYQPGVGASAGALVAFYGGNSTRILIAAALFSLNILNLLWFAAALRTTLADAGQDGWGAAATASSAVFGGLFLLLVTVTATLAYSIAGSGNNALTSGLNDFAWVLVVLSSFPRAMLIMAGSFGLWRAGQISNELFATGVAAMVLVLLGGTTWLAVGFWAPDGAYSRFVSPIIGLVWVVAASGILLKRSPATRVGW
jgi:hypothetical protein